MTAAPTIDTPVGQLVTDRPSRSRVFQRLGIDFCCGGKKPLAEVCRDKGLDPQTILATLLAGERAAGGADTGPSDAADPAAMTLAGLCDHIEQTHHAYLKQELPRLHQMIAKVAAVHGDRCPWMRDVLEVFVPFAQEMASHMMKEDRVLFPMIRAIEAAGPDADLSAITGHCGGTLDNPVRMMEHEHDDAGEALRRMHELTDGYTPPLGACNTFRATLDGLRELEEDMHQHVHKENNVLFPRALELERSHTTA